MNTLIKTVALRLSLVTGLLAALVVPAAAQTVDQTAETGSYGYLRVVEGKVTLTPADGESAAAEINQPVLAGDHLSVPGRAHAEIILADHNVLRVDGGSELVIERQAGETNRDDQATVIRLIEGNVQLAVTQDSLGDQLPRIDTPNSTIYIKNYGVYRLTAQSDGFSQVVVRRGTAQVVTDDGDETVRADQEAAIESGSGEDREAGIDVRQAGGFDSLERWARRLDDEAASALRASNTEAGDDGELDDNLRYQASSLASYGSWVRVEGNRYWRPRVEAGWRPYWHGRWAYTPAGLTWIAYEPWGWVPFHYGSWNYLDGYGWVWKPGYVWSPAWVYWYWGPSYVGWCPTGFYTHFYGDQFGVDFGFRSGVYGWAGGDWGLFDRWSFVGTGYFRDGYRAGYRRGYWDGRRDVQRYAIPIDRVRGHGLERGVTTTDTKPLRPNTWIDHGAVLHALDVHPSAPGARGPHQGRGTGAGGRDIPDVTTFIARKPLSTEVVQTVGARGPGHAQDGTPFKPATLGKPGRGGHEGNGRSAGDRTWTRTGTTEEVPGAKPGSQPGSKPGRVNVDGGKPGRPGRPVDTTGRPADGRPADGGSPVDTGKPRTWERPGRPAPNADGGAPKPRAGSGDKPDRSPVDTNGRPPRTERPDRPTATERPPVDNNKPTWKRPETEAPKPDRGPVTEKPRPERREPAPPRAEPRREQPERPARVEPRREPERPRPEPRVEPKREPEKPKEKPQPPPPARGN